MVTRSFLKSGHAPTLLSAFLYFDLSFMVWVLLGLVVAAIASVVVSGVVFALVKTAIFMVNEVLV